MNILMINIFFFDMLYVDEILFNKENQSFINFYMKIITTLTVLLTFLRIFSFYVYHELLHKERIIV